MALTTHDLAQIKVVIQEVVDPQFTAVYLKFDSLEDRFDGLEGRVNGLDQKVDNLKAKIIKKIEQEIDDFALYTTTHFQEVFKRLDVHDQAFIHINERLDSHDQNFQDIANQLDQIARKQEAGQLMLDHHDQRIGRLEKKTS